MIKFSKLQQRWQRIIYLTIKLGGALLSFLLLELVTETILVSICNLLAKKALTINMYLLFVFITLAAVITLKILIKRFRIKTIPNNNHPKNTKIFKKWEFYVDIIAILICIFVATVSLGIVANTNHQISTAQQLTSSNLLKRTPIKIETIISSVVIAPLVEEFFFRYIIFGIIVQIMNELLNRLAKKSSESFPVMFLSAGISNIFFVTIHLAFSFSGFLTYWLMGMGFSYMYIKYRNIWTSIITHWLWNSCAILVLLFL